MLKYIRDNQLESRLAHDCVTIGDDKNKDIKIPHSIVDLASSYKSGSAVIEEKETKKKKKITDETEAI